MLNPVHLQTLAAVLRTGSFADAARELGYSGSAVSQQISRLERAARVVLFDRDGHSITPTPAAKLLADRSRELLAAIRDLEDDVQSIASGRLGTLRVGSFPTASKKLLPLAFSHFLEAKPQVTLRLGEAETDDLIGQLLDRQIDVALVYHYDLVPRSLPDELLRVPLLEEDLQLLVPETHEFVGRESLLWSDLADETWITTRQDAPGAACLRSLCAQAKFEPRIGFRSNDYEVVREFVRSGHGLALVPSLCGGEIEGARALPTPSVDVHRRVSILHRGEELNPVIPGFLSALLRAAADISSEHVRPDTGNAGGRSA